ncbi:exocyst complex component Sec6-domain-containing protein [Amylocarpus encephaloides]|uniref:Exocyst complex component Sec6-domain-containing protein n=1 Tax=Amylocarpus encephaloides TaxID=45428 RepID=A0A9P8C3J2_9HELO|nr:exocyst complex component Sec6-domain-containing protein [Amylocarpus encephaloides]
MESSAIKLAELLRHPDDLDKIPAMNLEYTRKKDAVDSQLRSGLKEQLEITQSGMNGITEGQRTVQQIKEEMMKIDKLCAEAQNMIRDFPNINLVSQTHRNFNAVEAMRANLESFNERVNRIERMLRDDDVDEENMPNLLVIHYELTQLRNIRDDAMEQIQRADDTSLQATLEDYFSRLDSTVAWFDENIGKIALNLINVLISGNNGLVVRFAVIMEAEEMSDRIVAALQEALKDHKEMAARFQGITDGAKQTRGYKGKFLQSIELNATEQIAGSKQAFLEDPTKLGKNLKWFFNDLNAVKQGMVPLMPKKWKIFQTYGKIYHKIMHDFLVDMIEDPDTSSANMLSILNWPELYYTKMAKLGFKQDELEPHVIDGREAELVREFRQLIIRYLDQWLDRIFKTEKKDFSERNVDGSNLDVDEYGYFRTKNLVDMWRMLQEQIDAAGTSQRQDVAEGAIDAMILRLKSRQQDWQKMLDDEAARYVGSTPDLEGFQALQDWLVATANDQIACIDDNEEEERDSYLTSFRQKFEPIVSPQYLERADEDVSALRDGYVDLSTHCIAKFAQLIFAVDFRTVMPDFFTPKWYSATAMKQMVVTFEEYVGDYKSVVHHSLLDIFIEELADELLIRYLSSVKNKGAKFRRQDPYKDKLFNDVSTAFEFFTNSSHLSEDVAETIKQKWRVTEPFLQLIESDKSAVPEVFAEFKMDYWDLQLSWVEAALRARDDFDRSMLNAVKARAAQIDVAPDAKILKRNRLPPSNWWAASPAVATTNGDPKDARLTGSKSLKRTATAIGEIVEVAEESVSSSSVKKTSRPPNDARPATSKSQKAMSVATLGPVEVREAREKVGNEREGKVGESSSGGENRKRNRAPPSNWWAASPSVAGNVAEARKDSQGSKGKKGIETDNAEIATSGPMESHSRSEGLKKSKAAKPRMDRNVETATTNITNSVPTASSSGSGGSKRKRSRPSNWWEANTSSLLESDENPGQDVASQPRNQLNDVPETANWGDAGKTGDSRSKQRSSNPREQDRRENDEGKKGGRPPSSDSMQYDEGGKENRLNKGSRKERRHQSSGEEIIDVLTASSTFGKGRTKRGDHAVPIEGRSLPELSEQRSPKKGSKSSKTLKSASSQAPAINSQPRQKKPARPSGEQSSRSKRRAKDDPELHGNKRRRSNQVYNENESEEEEEPDYQRLIPVIRKVNHGVIEAKWDALPSGCIDLISDLLEATQRPVIARLKDENQRRQAKSALQLIARKLISKMKKGVPFPGAGSRSREEEFNFEKVIDRNRILEGQLTADIDANKLLDETLKKEIALLESEQETLAILEANAKTESAIRKEAGRKTHPLLQSAATASTGDPADSTLGDMQSRLMPSLGNYKDDALIKVVQDIESHVDSLNGNVMQLAGIPEAMSKAKAAVQATLFDHLESTRYEDVVLGGEWVS